MDRAGSVSSASAAMAIIANESDRSRIEVVLFEDITHQFLENNRAHKLTIVSEKVGPSVRWICLPALMSLHAGSVSDAPSHTTIK